MYRRRIIVALAVALCILVVPFPQLVRPDWDVWVVDEHGNALEGMNVRLIYQDYSLESRSHEDTQTTDGSGHTRFGAKTTISTVGARMVGTLRSFSETGFHASFGRYAYLIVFGKGRQAEYRNASWTGGSSSKQSRIVTRPDSSPDHRGTTLLKHSGFLLYFIFST
jgi:hypothetical protein